MKMINQNNRKSRSRAIATAVLALLLVIGAVLAGCGSHPAGGGAADQNPNTVSQTEEAGTQNGQAGDQNQAGAGESESANPQSSQAGDQNQDGAQNAQARLDPHGTYTSKEDVALFLYTYGRLPDNFITKKQAGKLGWQGGSLENIAPGKCIGGDYFGNYEGRLPEDEKYHECDIDTLGKKSRGAKRLVYSDEHIYYTEDHYNTFELLYGEDE